MEKWRRSRCIKRNEEFFFYFIYFRAGTPTITVEGSGLDMDSISVVSSIAPSHMYQCKCPNINRWSSSPVSSTSSFVLFFSSLFPFFFFIYFIFDWRIPVLLFFCVFLWFSLFLCLLFLLLLLCQLCFFLFSIIYSALFYDWMPASRWSFEIDRCLSFAKFSWVWEIGEVRVRGWNYVIYVEIEINGN